MSAGPIAILKRLPGPVRLLILGTFVNRAGGFIIPFLSIILKRDFGLDEDRLKWLLAAYGVGTIFSILAGGWFTDKIGRRVTLTGSLAAGGALAIAMGFVDRFGALLPLLMAYGFFGELYRPAASAILGDLLPSQQRPAGFAALRLAVNLGFAFGTAMGGLLADANWRILFWGDGATSILYGLIVLSGVPETKALAVAAAGRPEAPARGDSPWRDSAFLVVTFISLLFSFVFFNHITTLPLTVAAAGYRPRVFGWLVALNCLLIGLFELSIVEWLRPRFRRLRVASFGVLLLAAGFGSTGLLPHWGWFAATVVFWTAGEIAVSPQMMAFIADWSPPASRGRYLSVYQASWSVAFALCPLVFLPLHARLSEPRFWLTTVPPCLLGAWLLRRLDRTADRPELLRGSTTRA